jgi:hypothetical protein
MIEPLTGKRALGETFSLHPENPKYFLFRGKPTVLVTSGEHYGALLNGDFNFDKYLETLSKDGLNHTRVFMGSYREEAGNFNIQNNTLAPGKTMCRPGSEARRQVRWTVPTNLTLRSLTLLILSGCINWCKKPPSSGLFWS